MNESAGQVRIWMCNGWIDDLVIQNC